ncbi:MAG: hypothetical protein U5R06_13885 [candidate division KSB1 bacterium]|nr:hypothetical protein [candidate division KSB1 bacterium]
MALFFILLAGFLFASHEVIPHEHHDVVCAPMQVHHDSHAETAEPNDSNCDHCHAFGEPVVDWGADKDFVVAVNLLIDPLVSEYRKRRCGFIFSDAGFNSVPAYLSSRSPLRAPPF